MDPRLARIINRCLAIFTVTLLWGPLYADSNWLTQPDCALVSVVKVISDGYQETPVQLRLDTSGLRVLTESNIAINQPGTGLSVDGGNLIAPDRLEKNTNLVFSDTIAHITQKFISGNSVEVGMHFWPTWPDTGRKTVRFSLLGFTRAYRQRRDCQ